MITSQIILSRSLVEVCKAVLALCLKIFQAPIERIEDRSKANGRIYDVEMEINDLYPFECEGGSGDEEGFAARYAINPNVKTYIFKAGNFEIYSKWRRPINNQQYLYTFRHRRMEKTIDNR